MSTIVLLSEVGSHGGIPRFNRLLVESLGARAASSGARLDVLSLNDEGTLQVADVKIRGFGRSKARFSLAAARLVRDQAHALVLSGHVNLSPIAEAARRFPGAGPIRHGLITHGIEVWGELDAQRTAALQRVDFATAVSEYTRRQLVEFHGLRREQVDLLPNALPPRFAEAGPALPVVPGRILSCSRLEPYERYKGIEHLVRALPALRKEIPHAHLVVVGDGSERKRLEGIADALGVRDVVRFAGAVPDDELQRHYAECEIFAMPSRKEGFGIVYLEAMAYGKPCLAARAGGAPEVVLHGETGVVVEYGDVTSIAQYLAWLFRDPVRARQLGEGGRKRLAACFTAERFQQRLSDILDARLASPPRPAGPAASELPVS